MKRSSMGYSSRCSWKGLFFTATCFCACLSLLAYYFQVSAMYGRVYTPQRSKDVIVNITWTDSQVLHLCPLMERDSTIVETQYLCKSSNTGASQTYLTLFTTMTYRTDKLRAYNNVIRLWPTLGANVRTILFLAPSRHKNSSDYHLNLEVLTRTACEKGWDVMTAPGCNPYNYPILKYMFKVASNVSQSEWYGYSNADILFTDQTLLTLRFLDNVTKPQVDFVVGRRKNIVVKDSLEPISSIQTVKEILATSGKYHRADAIDYFFTRRNTYPWHKIPLFVVGRSGFDNWLVSSARHYKIAACDASLTNPVLHQSLEGVGSDHRKTNLNDHSYNHRLLGKWYPLCGYTVSVPYLTTFSEKDTRIVLLARQFSRRRPCLDVIGTYVVTKKKLAVV